MNTSAFVDTAGWIDLFNANDGLHARAQAIYRSLVQRGTRLITTEFVLLEVADALSIPALRANTITVINNLRRGTVEVTPVSEELLAKGWALYSQRLDKEWGLTDCTSFVVMQERQIHQALTSDHHFAQAGFTCLL